MGSLIRKIARKRISFDITSGMSPNAEDDNTYTPMYVASLACKIVQSAYPFPRHAAASYAHLELLDYLISKGGDINHADSDGETPLFTVESVEVAKWMIERGAKYDVKNNEGETVRLQKAWGGLQAKIYPWIRWPSSCSRTTRKSQCTFKTSSSHQHPKR